MGGVYMFRKEDQFVLYVITQDSFYWRFHWWIDYLYHIPITISEDNFSLKLVVDSISRQILDGEELNEVSGHIAKIVWNETFVCRLVDSKFVLFTDLGENPKTIRLHNNQYSLTRALQSFLNTFSNILDVEYYENELWFLYDNYEIQHYNLCTMKWSGDYQLSMYLFHSFLKRPSTTPLPRRMSKGFLRLANDRALVVYQDSKQAYTFHFFQLPSFTFLQEVPLPTPFPVSFLFFLLVVPSWTESLLQSFVSRPSRGWAHLAPSDLPLHHRQLSPVCHLAQGRLLVDLLLHGGCVDAVGVAFLREFLIGWYSLLLSTCWLLWSFCNGLFTWWRIGAYRGTHGRGSTVHWRLLHMFTYPSVVLLEWVVIWCDGSFTFGFDWTTTDSGRG